MALVVFQHHKNEPTAVLGEILQQHGHKLKTIRLYAGDSVPVDLDDVDGVLSMGGPMNVDEVEKNPWIPIEIAYLKKAHETGKPIVGVCLGAQLIGTALGGKVTQMVVGGPPPAPPAPHGAPPPPAPAPGAAAPAGAAPAASNPIPHGTPATPPSSGAPAAPAAPAPPPAPPAEPPKPIQEVGWASVKQTFQGQTETIYQGIPWDTMQFHVHGQEVSTLPPGAVPLAGSKLCKNQAFKVGYRTYGFQYHFEWNYEDLKVAARDPFVVASGGNSEQIIKDIDTHYEGYRRAGNRLCETMAIMLFPIDKRLSR